MCTYEHVHAARQSKRSSALDDWPVNLSYYLSGVSTVETALDFELSGNPVAAESDLQELGGEG